jgi:hypothetical protein
VSLEIGCNEAGSRFGPAHSNKIRHFHPEPPAVVGKTIAALAAAANLSYKQFGW